MTTHTEQQQIWDEEHRHPNVLPQMDSDKVSSGVLKFHDFLSSVNVRAGRGIEMGCGKGRNVIWLAQQGYEMTGLDFSPHAIDVARVRAESAGVAATFLVHDATTPWPFESDAFGFAVDCFGSTDIVDTEGRAFAIRELYRTLRPGAYLLAYLLSTEDEYHKEMIKISPAGERNAFLHETGKFEKTYDDADITHFYGQFDVVKKERIEKTDTFKGQEYANMHYWLVFRKPVVH
jgi:SAM-dependent methyltransferase